MKSLFRLAIILLSLLCCAACGGGLSNGGNQTDTPEESAEFTIELTDITATSVHVAITPKNRYIRYYFDLLRAEYYRVYNDQYGFQRFVNATINSLTTKEAISKSEALDTLLSTGDISYTFTALEPETEYYVVVMGLDINGQISTEVYSKQITTL